MPVTKEMHPEFMQWYQTVSFGDDTDLAERRYSAVQALLETLSTQKVEALIRIAFRLRLNSCNDALVEIKTALTDEYDERKNDRELEILCAAALAILLDWKDDWAATAALSLMTTNFGGGRTTNLPMDLVGLAGICLRRIANDSRKRPDLKLNISGLSKLDFSDAKTKVQQQLDIPNVQGSLDLVAARVQSALAGFSRSCSDTLERLALRVRIQDEELQMLWWLFGERSFTLDIPFKSIPFEWKPLVVARELADATEVLPGLGSASVILERAGLKRGGKKITVAEAVNACDIPWLESLSIAADISPVVSPIHSAIYRRLDAGNETAWVPAWEAASQISAAYSLSPLVLGELFYRERLLALFSDWS